MKSLLLLNLMLLSLNLSAGQTIKEKQVRLKFPTVNLSIEVQVASRYREMITAPDEFETSVIRNFKVPDGIEKDAGALGFKLSELRTFNDGYSLKEPYYKYNYSWGNVYTWNTPTKGSAIYSYICRSQDSFCLKIGPYQNVSWEFKWDSLVISELKKKQG
jgi:hypothetical protein